MSSEDIRQVAHILVNTSRARSLASTLNVFHGLINMGTKCSFEPVQIDACELLPALNSKDLYAFRLADKLGHAGNLSAMLRMLSKNNSVSIVTQTDDSRQKLIGAISVASAFLYIALVFAVAMVLLAAILVCKCLHTRKAIASRAPKQRRRSTQLD